jgi:hypothetical protein
MTMKQAIATLCLLAATFSLAEAQYHSRWTISLTMGPSVPVGKFASKDGHDSTALFARTGIAANLAISYRLRKHWGLSMLLNGEDNAVNNSAIDTRLETANPGYTVQYDQAHWVVHRLLAGAFGEWPLGKGNRWSFTVGLYAGAASTQEPNISNHIYLTDQSGLAGGYNSYSTYHNGAFRFGFAYEGNAGLQYQVGKLVFLCGQVDYAGSWVHMPYGSHSLEFVSPTPAVGGSGFPIIVPVPSYNQPLSAVNITVGAGVRL